MGGAEDGDIIQLAKNIMGGKKGKCSRNISECFIKVIKICRGCFTAKRCGNVQKVFAKPSEAKKRSFGKFTVEQFVSICYISFCKNRPRTYHKESLTKKACRGHGEFSKGKDINCIIYREAWGGGKVVNRTYLCSLN